MADNKYPTNAELHVMKDLLLRQAFDNHKTDEQACRLAYTVSAAIASYEEQRTAVKAKIAGTIRDLERELATLEESSLDYIGINTLGILQGNGPALDRECALLGERAQSLRTMLSLVK